MIIELILNRWWVPAYFRKGILLFKKSFRFYKESSPLIDDLNSDLTFEFHRALLPAIVFDNISDNEIAFRESFIHFGIPNLFIMRGLIKIDKTKRQVIMMGFLNWYVLCILCTFALYILIAPENITERINLFGLFLLIIVILYLGIIFKFRLYHKIFKYIENKYL